MICYEELLLALNRLDTIVVVTDAKGNIRYVNEAFEDKYGYSKEEAIGQNPRILKSDYHDPSFYKNLWDTVLSGITWEGIFLNKTKSGKLIWERAKISPIMVDEEIDGFIATKEDITYKKELEEQFHKEKFLLDELFDNAPVGAMLFKPIYNDGEFQDLMTIKANPIAANVFNKLGITGLTMRNFLEEYEQIYSKVDDLINSKQIFELKCPSLDKHLNLKTFPLGEGRFCMYIHDITKYKNTISALKESEQRYHSLVEDSPALIRRFNKDGAVSYINSYYADYYNKTPDKLLGKNIFKLFNVEDRNVFKENLQKLTPENPIVEYQQKITLPKDEIRWQKWIDRALFDSSGNIVEYQSVGMDFTRLKNIEIQLEEQKNKLNAIFDNGLIGITVLNSSGDILMANSKFTELIHYKEDITNLNYFDYVAKEQIEQSRENFKRLFEGKIKKINVQREIHRKDGSIFIADIFTAPISVKKGKVIEVVGLVIDITERYRIEQELKASEKKLKKLNNTKDKLFSVIAHDIRNPFNAILGFSTILDNNLNSLSTNEIKEFISRIVEASEETYKLLEDLLTWAKSQLGQLKAKPCEVSTENVIHECLGSLKSLTRNKNIKINISDTTTQCAYVDKEMIKFVIRNLLHNAIKFSHPNTTIEYSTKEIPNDKIAISIRDHGVGIKKEKLEILFNLEEFLTTNGTSHEKGTGLGLSLSKEMIELNNGEINVSSEVGKGSEFVITLPKCEEKRDKSKNSYLI
ncbi:PAS domain-containing sensor histidine kinase [Plebeiibacterium sediminum]|uniref:histidine kinase n=1 Tax=Plebeiibacterium sediminum TaxID=2992112 RepID=A0AAE3M2U6_9BACT|nr:PAS domain S-box protein [Plebeiobacterium sediminum]MCW3786104.1 PAS domain S-box protein [Plebeiobacterium sediminum]